MKHRDDGLWLSMLSFLNVSANNGPTMNRKKGNVEIKCTLTPLSMKTSRWPTWEENRNKNLTLPRLQQNYNVVFFLLHRTIFTCMLWLIEHLIWTILCSTLTALQTVVIWIAASSHTTRKPFWTCPYFWVCVSTPGRVWGEAEQGCCCFGSGVLFSGAGARG